MEGIDGRWTEPQLAPFSGQSWDFDLNFSPTGNQFLFSSVRSDPENRNPAIWVVSRNAEGWSEARHIGSPFNTDEDYHHPSVTNSGVLYFYSDREGNLGEGDIYRSRIDNGGYQEPEILGPNVNSELWEGDVSISPDEDFLIFVAERPNGVGSADLHISFRRGGNTWTEAVNMGPQINSSKDDACPNITSDGRYIFFSSKRENLNGYPQIDLAYKKQMDLESVDPEDNYDIYWVDAKTVEQYRPR